VIPPPAPTVPRLLLPRLGADRHGGTTPLLISASPGSDPAMSVTGPDQQYTHPRHRLGISSFALDTSTRLSGKTSPEGILYSGGRDGQVLAHELGATLKHRSKPYGVNPDRKAVGKSWEAITGWKEIDGYGEDEQDASSSLEIPYENAWELDPSAGEPNMVGTIIDPLMKESNNFPETFLSSIGANTLRLDKRYLIM
jgi:WD repeat-containing protein 48